MPLVHLAGDELDEDVCEQGGHVEGHDAHDEEVLPAGVEHAAPGATPARDAGAAVLACHTQLCARHGGGCTAVIVVIAAAAAVADVVVLFAPLPQRRGAVVTRAVRPRVRVGGGEQGRGRLGVGHGGRGGGGDDGCCGCRRRRFDLVVGAITELRHACRYGSKQSWAKQ